jgi:hypothetical protein
MGGAVAAAKLALAFVLADDDEGMPSLSRASGGEPPSPSL